MKKQDNEMKARSQFTAIMMRLRKNKLAMLGLAILLFMAALALCADFIADYDTQVVGQDMDARLQGPSADHWFGTDQFGRDVFARIIHGARISLTLSIIAMAIAVAIGAIIGAIAGYFGGFRDNILMRLMDILLAIPPMLMSISIVAALGQSMSNLLIALSIAYIPVFARVIRSSILSIKDQEFIEASRLAYYHKAYHSKRNRPDYRTGNPSNGRNHSDYRVLELYGSGRKTACVGMGYNAL